MMTSFITLSLILFLSGQAIAEEDELRKPYEEDSVLQINPAEKIHLRVIKDLAKDPKLDFWTERISVGEPVHVRVPSSKYGYVKTVLRKYRIPHTLEIEDLQENVDKEWMRLHKRFSVPGQNAFNIDDFNTYDDIMTWIEEIKTKCAAGVTCRTYSIGSTLEGRDMKVLHISSGAGKKGYWIDGGIHAREWISPATVLKITNHLIADYNSDATVKRMVDGYDWYIMPMMNPDGYIYSWTNERYWRKNRNPNGGGGECVGVDLNRNYDVKWMNDGTSSEPCSDTYGGASAASEPETQAVQAEAQRLAPNLIAWLTVHSYANVYIFPYGHSDESGQCARAPDHEDMMNVANRVADAIQETFNTYWRRGTSCEVLYASSGATDDYVKAKTNVKYTATLELRGPDFVLPPSEIQPSYQEVWNGVVALVDATGQ